MKAHCEACGQKPHVGEALECPELNGKKKLLSLGWAPGAGPGIHLWQPSGHPGTFQSQSPRPITLDLTQPEPPTLPRPLSSVGPLCPPGLSLSTPLTLVSSALTHPVTLFRHPPCWQSFADPHWHPQIPMLLPSSLPLQFYRALRSLHTCCSPLVTVST